MMRAPSPSSPAQAEDLGAPANHEDLGYVVRKRKVQPDIVNLEDLSVEVEVLSGEERPANLERFADACHGSIPHGNVQGLQGE